METNKIQWKRIEKGDKLPCQSFLRKKDGEILKLSTVGGVKVGQDCYYLPVDEVINVIKNYPIEESEEEQSKKWILEYLHDGLRKSDEQFKDQFKVAIAWLEKQGEHKKFRDSIQVGDKVTRNEDGVLVNLSQLNRVAKPADKIEPKFKVGDWVVSPTGVYWHIDRIENNRYEVTSDTGKCADWSLDTDLYHLWTIQDAKDGDVLCTYECCKPKIVFILKGMPKKPYALSYYCYYNIMYPNFDTDSEKGCLAPNDEDVKPATKEQRDLLFSKMKENGYEWDAEKKELKKVEQKPIHDVEIPFGAKDSELEEVSYSIPNGYHAEIEDNKVVIKRGEKKPTEWSEEDEKQARQIERIVHNDGCTKKLQEQIADWFKSLKDRVQPRQEWSEEDEEMHRKCICAMRASACGFPEEEKFVEQVNNWLKSLRPQSTWRPSEEQMQVLEFISDYHTFANKNNQDIFNEFVKQLKKLREE